MNREKTFSYPESPEIIQYLSGIFTPEDSVLKETRLRSEKADLPAIQVGAMDGLHLEVLARIARAEKIVEIGTLGGYSGICLARALPPRGRLHTFELSPQNAEVARENFKKAGVEEKIRIHIGPALGKLPEIESEGPFDLVFIDADKANYPQYLHWAAENLRIGGVVIGDNTFAFGKIAQKTFADAQEEKTISGLQQFNLEIARGGRFRGTLLPTGEGLTVGVKVR